jgi:hypothetical protein
MHRPFGQGPASNQAAKPVPPLRPGQPKGSKMANKAKDNWRKWMWMFLGVIAALQLYFVRELLAAFALFALGFAGIAACLASLYLAQKGWESGVARLAASQNSWVLAARRATAVSEEWVRRPLRRPDSEPAH